jgi:Galactosyltransferase
MKFLIAVVNAHSRLEWQEAIRDTWLPMVPKDVSVRFFLGRGGDREPRPNEVFLDVDDGYSSLPSKIQAIMRWAYDHGYDFVMKCDDDVVLDVQALLQSGFEQHLYSGRGNRPPESMQPPIWVPYGFGYIVARACIPHILTEPLPEDNDDEKWVAKALAKNGVLLASVMRYQLVNRWTQLDPDSFSYCIHFCDVMGHYQATTEERVGGFYRVFRTWQEQDFSVPEASPKMKLIAKILTITAEGIRCELQDGSTEVFKADEVFPWLAFRWVNNNVKVTV